MNGPYTSKEAVITREEHLRTKAKVAKVAWSKCLRKNDWAGMRKASNITVSCHEETMYLIGELYRLMPLGHPNYKLYGDRLMGRGADNSQSMSCTGNHGLR